MTSFYDTEEGVFYAGVGRWRAELRVPGIRVYRKRVHPTQRTTTYPRSTFWRFDNPRYWTLMTLLALLLSAFVTYVPPPSAWMR